MEWHAIALLFECNANFVFNNFWGRIIDLFIGLLNGLRLVNLGLVDLYAILVLRTILNMVAIRIFLLILHL